MSARRGGYESSGRQAADLAAPPSGPAPGARPAPELHKAVTVYLPPDVDREQFGRLVKSLCSLNGIPAAIELHAPLAASSSD